MATAIDHTRLLPCPFCGETPDINNPATFQDSQGTKWGAVICCCTGPEVRTGYGPVEEWRGDAIEAWNTRVPALEARSAFEGRMASEGMIQTGKEGRDA